MIVSNEKEIYDLINTIEENIAKTKEALKTLLDGYEAKDALTMIKFDKTAFEPITGEPVNFIEMVNQSYSDLVILKAALDLIKRFPDKSFKLSMGVSPGHGIESTDHSVIAKCFAAVSAFSNQKINKDSEKLSVIGNDTNKFIYFYSREDSVKKLNNIMEKYPDITYIRFTDTEMIK